MGFGTSGLKDVFDPTSNNFDLEFEIVVNNENNPININGTENEDIFELNPTKFAPSLSAQIIKPDVDFKLNLDTVKKIVEMVLYKD